ncbi:MAG TPA: hypothetical protein VJ508_02675, partial [Saprospiraceae bacterium]|nr:hypothetical protein [Saprospiraceae bacterium]
VKQVLMSSTRPIPGDVTEPGTFDTVKASALCVTGGMVDVVSAMKLASATKGKAKLKSRVTSTEYVPGKA